MKTEELSNKERDREGGNWEFHPPLSERLLPKLEELAEQGRDPTARVTQRMQREKGKITGKYWDVPKVLAKLNGPRS